MYILKIDINKDLEKEQLEKCQADALYNFTKANQTNWENLSLQIDNDSRISWYLCEEIFSIIRPQFVKNDNLSWPYDFIKKQAEPDKYWKFRNEYYDMKTFNTTKTPEEAKQLQYKWYIQHQQIEKIKRFCCDNNINFIYYYFISTYYNKNNWIIYYIIDKENSQLYNIIEKNHVEEKNPANTLETAQIIKNYILTPNWDHITYIPL